MPTNPETLFPVICPCCGQPVSYVQWKTEMQKALDAGDIDKIKFLTAMTIKENDYE